MERRFARVCPGKGEKRVHEQCQAIGLLEDAPDDLSITLLARVVTEPDLAHAADCGQRSAQLVRDICREAAKLSEGFLDPPQGDVEDPSQMAQLVIGILDGK